MRVRKGLYKPLVGLASAACVAGLWSAPQAEARDGVGRAIGIGIGVGVGIGIVKELMDKGGQGSPNTGSKAPRSQGGGGASNSGGGQPTPKAAPTPTVSVAFSTMKSELEEFGANNRFESDRNVDDAIAKFISDVKFRHGQLRGKSDAAVASSLIINEVTAGKIKVIVEDAYRQANLSQFERLAGEMWTKARLTVFILRQARRSLGPYYEGAGAKGPSVEDLHEVFHRSAREVYVRALETAEVIGVGHSFERFIRTIYENSDRADQSLWTTGADGRYERLMSGVIAGVPMQVFTSAEQQTSASSTTGVDLERQFQFRFRARRTLYDCLSASYVDLARGNVAVDANAGGPAGVVVRGARTEPVAQGATLTTLSNEVWQRAEVHVGRVCRDEVLPALKAATDGTLRPQPARHDNYAQAGGRSGERSAVPVRDRGQ